MAPPRCDGGLWFLGGCGRGTTWLTVRVTRIFRFRGYGVSAQPQLLTTKTLSIFVKLDATRRFARQGWRETLSSFEPPLAQLYFIGGYPAAVRPRRRMVAMPGVRRPPPLRIRARTTAPSAQSSLPSSTTSASSSGAALLRTSFTTTLHRRLAVAARRLPGVELDLSKYSGVSFRKGCLSTLGALNVPAHRLADHADHATVDSSRIYTVDTVGERAANSVLIGSVFHGVR